MPDQAEELRRLARIHLKSAKVIAIASGKGGVGKTNLSVNLSIALALMKKTVTMLDFDLGLANADLLFNAVPRYNLSHVLSGKTALRNALVSPYPGVKLLPGTSGMEELADLPENDQQKLFNLLESIQRDSDFIIIDTSAGVSKNVINFAACADEIIIITTPEPTAMIDAYAAIKLIAKNPEHGNIRIVINMAANKIEAEKISSGIIQVCTRFLNVYVEKLGYILADSSVSAAVKKKNPFVLQYPDSYASACVMQIAKRIILENEQNSSPVESGFFKKLFGFFRKSG
ncbi:MAG: MinD/ParA family protein [Planctomycetes bacterium]|nr:MinD/ParA family protein [Planctomycetota bacterium]